MRQSPLERRTQVAASGSPPFTFVVTLMSMALKLMFWNPYHRLLMSVAAVKLAPGTGTPFNNAREGRVIPPNS